ncbi:hypothetical protein [Brackiella oedipodis]|uniref:hypothetical protein n=1 Tax=Brackiella oedipodis TaxID=124225 RepID=UPI00048E6514|nr:hypothetical protein [Brackiella oedipodis]
MNTEPKSYMPEEERQRRLTDGTPKKALPLIEASYAEKAGDGETAWQWLARAELPAHCLTYLKKEFGTEFILSYGFNTKLADEKYGPDWLKK